MQNWLQQQSWWIAIVLTILIALFPQTFTALGTSLITFLVAYWLQVSLIIIIILLLILLKRR